MNGLLFSSPAICYFRLTSLGNVPYLNFATLAQNDRCVVHIDDDRSYIRHFLIIVSVLVLCLHRKVWQAGGLVTGLGESVRTGTHEVMYFIIKGVIMRVTGN